MKKFVSVGNFAKIDTDRKRRTGIPEIIFCEGKTTDQILKISKEFSKHSDKVILTKATKDIFNRLKKQFSTVDFFDEARIIVVRKTQKRENYLGNIGILTAGTADIPVAEEARVIAEELGCKTFTAYDVGVAGVHRLTTTLRRLLKKKIDVMIVVAGMEGALPSLVSGMVDMPILAVPTSVSHGSGIKGLSALLSMLNTCSPGIATFNIDNGIGAAAFAIRLLRRMK